MQIVSDYLSIVQAKGNVSTTGIQILVLNLDIWMHADSLPSIFWFVFQAMLSN